MSTIIMAACWPLQGMSPAQKAVLISLADQSNDDGVCWPGIATIARRTCLSERAVQEAIAWLQAVGLVFRSYRFNSSTSYTINPGSYNPKNSPPKRSRSKKLDADGAPGEIGAPGADGAPGASGAPPGELGAPHPPQQAHLGGEPGAPKSSMNRKGNRKGTPKEPFPPAAPPARKAGGGSTDADDTALQEACRATWMSYCQAYVQRYGVKPVRNAKVNDNVKALVKRLGYVEAPLVAAWYVERVGEAYVLKDSHGVGALLAKAESYRTQWARGQAMTGTAAQAADKTSANADAIEEAKRLLRERAGKVQGAGKADEGIIDG